MTGIISLHSNKTNSTTSCTLLLRKTAEKLSSEILKAIKNTLRNKSGNPESFERVRTFTELCN